MPTVFKCGRGFVPGSQGPGVDPPLKPTTPVVLIPDPPPDTDPPFLTPPPYKPTRGPGPPGPGIGSPGAEKEYHACITVATFPCPKPNDDKTRLEARACVPCTPKITLPGGVVVVDPDCKQQSLAECERTCKDISGICPPSGPITQAGTPSIGTVAPGGASLQYQCQELRYICPGDENLPVEQQRVQLIYRGCVPYNSANPTSGLIASSIQVGGPQDGQEYQIWLGPPFSTSAACSAVCVPQIEERDCNVITTGGEPLPGLGQTTTQTGDPTGEPTGEPFGSLGQTTTQGGSVTTPNQPSVSNNAKLNSIEITTIQQNLNANVITASEVIQNEDFRNLRNGVLEPNLFEPELNFFETGANRSVSLISNTLNREFLNDKVTPEISDIVNNSETDEPWNEVTLQNLSEEQLIQSIDPTLVNNFQFIRFNGGEPVGVSNMLNSMRKFILEGRVDEIDVSFYKGVAENQLDDSFDVLEDPGNQEYADRLAISYLANNLHTYRNDKSTPWQNFQVNRTRPLNEDLNLEIEVTTLSNVVKDLSIPNEGFQVDTISAVDQVTVPSIGSPNKLNIGDGGGYYVDATNLAAEGVAVPTNNVLEDAYYAPAAVRVKVLNLLGEDPALKITATSMANKHEFTSGDAGASAIKPLFFAIDLSSVEGETISDSLVEDYSATYSLLTASADIQRHLNNNALNTPMLSVDYRDPIYRYILDTSSFTLSMKDFNLAGFRDKALSTVGARFVRNIPFGLVVTPVAGGMFNPFNGSSKLDSYGDTHTRSLKVIPAMDQSIDETPSPIFRSYSLYNEDGSTRVGIGETESTQNIGYKYFEEDFTQTFYSASAGGYGFSSSPASAYGAAYMLREVIDYLATTYDVSTVTWYDVFSRMPMTRVGEMFYNTGKEFLLEVANGLRNGLVIESLENGYKMSTRILPEDSKTIIRLQDRSGVNTIKF